MYPLVVICVYLSLRYEIFNAELLGFGVSVGNVESLQCKSNIDVDQIPNFYNSFELYVKNALLIFHSCVIFKNSIEYT